MTDQGVKVNFAKDIKMQNAWPTNELPLVNIKEGQIQRYHAWFSKDNQKFWKNYNSSHKKNPKISTIFMGENGEEVETTCITTSPFPTILYSDTEYCGIVTKFVKFVYLRERLRLPTFFNFLDHPQDFVFAAEESRPNPNGPD